MDLEDKLASILEVCPKEYKTVLTSEQKLCGSELTEKHLENVMTDHFRSLQFREDDLSKSYNNDDELGISAINMTFNYCKKGIFKKDSNKSKNKSQKNNHRKKFSVEKKVTKKKQCWEKPGS